VLEKAPNGAVARWRATLGSNPATTARKVRSGFSAIRANNGARWPVSRSGCQAPIGLAAALPLARQRCA
jgi:hypothetical protein